MKEIVVKDLQFRTYIDKEQIDKRVKEISKELAHKHSYTTPLFLPILNGAFIFAADLLRCCSFPCEVSFIKVNSYEGTASTGQVQSIIGLNQSLEGRHVIVVEDIIDTGRTMAHLLQSLHLLNPASVELVALLFKPECLEVPVNIDYLGFEIPPKFVVGYGLDYGGFGRNLPDIYQLIENRPTNS